MKEINLIPADIHSMMRWNYRRIFGRTITWLILLIAVSWTAMEACSSHYSGVIKRDMETFAAMKQERLNTAGMLNRLDRILEGKERLSRAASAVNRFSGGRVVWSDIIGEMAAQNFNGMWFNLFKVVEVEKKHGREIQIHGFTLDNKSIAGLIDYLERSPNFRNARLSESRAEVIGKKQVYSFSVVCGVVK